MAVIRNADCRRTTTPNAVMTTLASPTQGDAGQVVWRVEMAPGAVGPRHAFDTEQVWTVLDGAATVELDTSPDALVAGDTIVLPAGAFRQIFADPERGFTAIAVAPAGTLVYAPGAAPGPDIAAPVDGGEKLAPAWVV